MLHKIYTSAVCICAVAAFVEVTGIEHQIGCPMRPSYRSAIE
jgi:hypothetical protein